MIRQYLPSLFDQTHLDRDQAIDNRNAGITQAVDHAEEVTSEWRKRAYYLLLSFLTEYKGNTFMAEQVRSYATSKGLPVPPSLRAWGGVMTKAKQQKVIDKVGIGSTTNVTAHRAMASIWKKL